SGSSLLFFVAKSNNRLWKYSILFSACLLLAVNQRLILSISLSAKILFLLISSSCSLIFLKAQFAWESFSTLKPSFVTSSSRSKNSCIFTFYRLPQIHIRLFQGL